MVSNYQYYASRRYIGTKFDVRTPYNRRRLMEDTVMSTPPRSTTRTRVVTPGSALERAAKRARTARLPKLYARAPYPKSHYASERGRDKFGHPVGVAIGKTTQTVQYSPVSNTETGLTLYSEHLTGIVQSGSGTGDLGEDDIHMRQRQQIELKGLELRMYGENGSNGSACTLHVAVLSCKNRPDDLTTPNPIPTAGFFRGYGPGRADTFNSATLASTEFNNSPINSDLYTVLMHRKYNLGPQGISVGQQSVDHIHPNYVNTKVYVNINRQIRFSDKAGSSCTDPIFLVYWWVPVNWITPPPFAQPVEYRLVHSCIAHWQEPGCKKNKLKT